MYYCTDVKSFIMTTPFIYKMIWYMHLWQTRSTIHILREAM